MGSASFEGTRRSLSQNHELVRLDAD